MHVSTKGLVEQVYRRLNDIGRALSWYHLAREAEYECRRWNPQSCSEFSILAGCARMLRRLSKEIVVDKVRTEKQTFVSNTVLFQIFPVVLAYVKVCVNSRQKPPERHKLRR